MICRNCDLEHPKDQITNPHYCIARMQERIEKLEYTYQQLWRRWAAYDAELKDCAETVANLRRQLAESRAEHARALDGLAKAHALIKEEL
jgi:septal ring factor EnvC (AmiA/AmiB activator)